MVEYRSPRLGFYNINYGYSPLATFQSPGESRQREAVLIGVCGAGAQHNIVLGAHAPNGAAHDARVAHRRTQFDKNFSSGAVTS